MIIIPDNTKPIDKYIKMYICFYKEEPQDHTFGSNHIAYEIYYFYESGVIQIDEIGAFGDRTVIRQFQDRRGRGITEDEMLENIKEFSNMTYKEFLEVLNK